jgi:hypothetical protein
MCAVAGIGAAAIIGGSALAGSAISAAGNKTAADEQADAAQRAQNISYQEFQTITGQEQPYLQSGYGALGQLNYLQGIGTPGKGNTAASSASGGYGSLNQPFTANTMKQYSPAYQFQLQQGQQGVLNQDASSQGAESGAALKDLISFNQGYANTAFNNAFNQYQTQQSNTYGRLAGIAQLGQAAAGQEAASGTTLAGQQAQSATNVGSAYGAGTAGEFNSLGSGIGTAGLLAGLYGNQAGGFSGPGNLSIPYTGQTGVDQGSGLNYLTGQ